MAAGRTVVAGGRSGACRCRGLGRGWWQLEREQWPPDGQGSPPAEERAPPVEERALQSSQQRRSWALERSQQRTDERVDRGTCVLSTALKC